MQIRNAGENALIVYFEQETSPTVSSQVQAAAAALESSLGEKLVDLVPSYASLLVVFDPFSADHWSVADSIRDAVHSTTEALEDGGKLFRLPAWYSIESGPDLENLADSKALSVDEVIEIHHAIEYRVYAIGFAPGFAYLGQVDPRIAAARLSTPRQKVPRGAIAIADRQSAVYPSESPGGWNLIGLCPKAMFDPNASPIMPVSVGDRVKFEPINNAEFERLGGAL